MRTNSNYYVLSRFFHLRKITSLLFTIILILSLPLCDRDKENITGGNHYWNNLSRFLAGLPVTRGSQFWPLTQSRRYKEYGKFMNNFWYRVERGTIQPILSWRTQNIPTQYRENTVFYPLSGADFINMYLMFPDSPEYLMIALEKSGSIPNPIKLSERRLLIGLSAIKSVIHQYGYLNYFQSRIMKKEMVDISLTGTTPVILIFMARLNLRIINVENIGINDSGKIATIDERGLINGKKPQSSGVRIHFSPPSRGLIQNVVYLSMRLCNHIVSYNSSTGRFLNSYNNMKTIMKSAVYLLHMKQYREVKDFVIRKSAIIVQDDSGVPYEDFAKTYWDIKLYGVYRPFPIKGCYVKRQAQLMIDYKRALPLPFRFGYGSIKGKNKSNLMIAVKKT
jgi:hypothetical protein